MSMSSMMCPPANSTSLDYTRHLLDIEKNFDLCGAFGWLTTNWTLCFYFMAIYMAAIFAGQKYMASRPPFQLRAPLLFWNIILAYYSTISAWRMLTAMMYAIQSHGFLASICSMVSTEHRQAVGLWMYLFAISKIAEFGDTVFIVLKKSQLTFLHCYHHVSVAFFVWSTGAFASPMHAYYCTLNVTVHSIMYSYYALRLLHINIAKQVKMGITFLQLLQMATGIFLTVYTYSAKVKDPSCYVGPEAIFIGSSIYCTYLLLFGLFFIREYFTRMKPDGTSNGYSKKML